MKSKLAIPLIFLASVSVNPELLKQLQALLAQLVAQVAKLQAEQVKTGSSAVATTSALKIKIVKPEITSLEPKHGPVGTLVTIRGRGFTPTGNRVYTSYGLLPDLPSADGETVTFEVRPTGIPSNLGAIKTATFPELRYRFYIKNNNGQTSVPATFVLDL